MAAKKLVLTGGGTAGHVTPNLALVPALRERGFEIEYVGSHEGIEKTLVARSGLPYHAVHTGKLRRYASWQNLIDPFLTLWGVVEAVLLMRRLRPRAVFSKGGFVAVPVVVGAWVNRIPVLVHESDLSPGLANRLSFPFARHVCMSFEETRERLANPRKAVFTGTPIRPELLQGDRARGIRDLGLASDRSTLLVFGGSLGAKALNDAVRPLARAMPADLQVLHVCGKGNLDPTLNGVAGYRQFEYLDAGFADVLACADVVVSRAGANTLWELLALRKPAILVPLPAVASRGDQIENAKLFADRGWATVVEQRELSPERLLASVELMLRERARFVAALERAVRPDSVRVLVDLIESAAR